MHDDNQETQIKLNKDGLWKPVTWVEVEQSWVVMLLK